MGNFKMKNYINPLLLILLMSLNACSEYWWTRGQPPSSKDLFTRANERIEDALKNRATERPEIAANAMEIKQTLSSLETEEISPSDLNQILSNVETSFKSLEGKISYGNRPSLNELSGQLRAIKSDISNASLIDPLKLSSIRLFGGRILMYLSTELQVPAPDRIA